MNIKYYNYSLNKESKIDFEKNLCVIYGKNGSGKTTISRNDSFNPDLVFNIDFIHKNIYEATVDDAKPSSKNKENFSSLWIGEKIINMKRVVQESNDNHTKYLSQLKDLEKKVNDRMLSLGIPSVKNLLDLLPKRIQLKYTFGDDIEKIRNEITVERLCSNIENVDSLNEEIVKIKNDILVADFVYVLDNNVILTDLFVNSEKEYLTKLNQKIYEYNEVCEKLRFLDESRTKRGIFGDEEAKWILDGLHKNYGKEHCILCNGSLVDNNYYDKWRELLDETLLNVKVELQDAIKELNKAFDSVLAKESAFNVLYKEFMQTLKKTKTVLQEINNKIKHNKIVKKLEISYSLDIESQQMVRIIENVRNYLINEELNNMFFLKCIVYELEQVKVGKKSELSTLMENEAEKIKLGINEVLQYLGLEKSLSITIDRRGNEMKFKMLIDGLESVKSLSEGQKHKLSLAVFLYSISTKNIENQVLFLDDPVVALDILSSIALVDYIKRKIIPCEPERIIIATHDLNYMYLQLQNIFSNPKFEEHIEVFRYCKEDFHKFPLEYMKMDDIELFVKTINKVSSYEEVILVGRFTAKIFRHYMEMFMRLNSQYTFYNKTSDLIGDLDIDDYVKTKLKGINRNLSTFQKTKNKLNVKVVAETLIDFDEAMRMLEFNGIICDAKIKFLKSVKTEEVYFSSITDSLEEFVLLHDYLNLTLSDGDVSVAMFQHMRHPRVQLTRNIMAMDIS